MGKKVRKYTPHQDFSSRKEEEARLKESPFSSIVLKEKKESVVKDDKRRVISYYFSISAKNSLISIQLIKSSSALVYENTQLIIAIIRFNSISYQSRQKHNRNRQTKTPQAITLGGT